MNDETIKFFSEIVKPWETLNKVLSIPFSMNQTSNDFITTAKSLAITIKHLPENSQNIKAKYLIKESLPYEIMHDLADSLKHGKLSNSERDCQLTISSMFERNNEAKVRFLRNRLSINHAKHGKIDFMKCALDSALFVSQKLEIKTNWSPKIFNNSGEFTNEINVHITKKHQIYWQGMGWEIVQLNEDGEYENVNLNGTVLFSMTSDF